MLRCQRVEDDRDGALLGEGRRQYRVLAEPHDDDFSGLERGSELDKAADFGDGRALLYRRTGALRWA